MTNTIDNNINDTTNIAYRITLNKSPIDSSFVNKCIQLNNDDVFIDENFNDKYIIKFFSDDKCNQESKLLSQNKYFKIIHK